MRDERTTLHPDTRDRRRWPRRSPSYTPDEIRTLRILRVHFRQNYLFCLLSDAKVLCVPLAFSAGLSAAAPWTRYQWHLIDDGRGLAWHTRELDVVVSLEDLLTHPGADISALPEST